MCIRQKNPQLKSIGPEQPINTNRHLAKKIVPTLFVFCLLYFAFPPAFCSALEPAQILVIANSDIAESVEIAQYYCAKRYVPTANILALALGKTLDDTITRSNYNKQLAEPIRKKLHSLEFAGKIRCLLTTYGVPIKVQQRQSLKDRQNELKQSKKLLQQEKGKIELLKQYGSTDTAKSIKKHKYTLTQLQTKIDYITGKETDASVDSELSMVLFDDYELFRWQPNKLMYMMPYQDCQSLMVCRIDGPGPAIVRGLIDKAIKAEETTLKGIAYVDSRGIADDKKVYSYGYFDQSLRDLANFVNSSTEMTVKHEQTAKLFTVDECPFTAIYCGWYSLRTYVDAFDFVDGAIGYHIASWEAVDLRDPNSTQWCPAMLADGITATLGAVAEPYLHTFPEPKAFFRELFNGRCLVEAYYNTKPFNSWRLLLIGDPLYKPFPEH